jgi:hypothetical protein
LQLLLLLAELLMLLLAELLLLLLGQSLQLIWLLVLLLLLGCWCRCYLGGQDLAWERNLSFTTHASHLFFCRSRLCVLAGRMLPCVRMHRVFVQKQSKCSLPSRVSKAILAQVMYCSWAKGMQRRGGTSSHVVRLSLLNHQAGGDLHKQLPQHGGSTSARPGSPG